MGVPLVIGIDAGATSTRCVVSTAGGTVLGRGVAGGANQNSSAGAPAAALTSALRAALADCGSGADPARVALGVVGAAGAGAAGRTEAQQAAEAAWRAAGLSGHGIRAVTDLEVAFAAGTPHRDGLLLLSGTGAAAVAFRAGRPHRRCDGYGWLLGDEGSAVWLGREALRAVLCDLDGRGPRTLLTGPVTAALEVAAHPDPDEHAQGLVRVAYRRPPAALGLLAPLVGLAAAAGDETARHLLEAAATHLLHALESVARRTDSPAASDPPAGPGPLAASDPLAGPDPLAASDLAPPAGRAVRREEAGAVVVLAGSVLLGGGPVADLVRTGIRQRFRIEPVEARDGAAGAAVLAIAELTGAPVGDAVHARLTTGR